QPADNKARAKNARVAELDRKRQRHFVLVFGFAFGGIGRGERRRPARGARDADDPPRPNGTTSERTGGATPPPRRAPGRERARRRTRGNRRSRRSRRTLVAGERQRG